MGFVCDSERMAAAVACGSASASWSQFKDSSPTNVLRKNSDNKNYSRKGFRVSCVSSAVSDPYKTLSIRPGASESEVKKAFRQLAKKVIFRLFFCISLLLKNVFFQNFSSKSCLQSNLKIAHLLICFFIFAFVILNQL